MSLDLDERTGWPKDLRFLLEKHPRPSWDGHPNLGALARFWLDRHEMFRTLAATLVNGTSELQEGAIAAADFQPWFVQRMGFFLEQLHHHHQIEDQNYFPLFLAAEPRLLRGFRVLEQDHGTLDQAIHGLASASNGLLHDLSMPNADLARSTAELGQALPRFLGKLRQHLGDEEDLIVPLILERSETALGLG